MRKLDNLIKNLNYLELNFGMGIINLFLLNGKNYQGYEVKTSWFPIKIFVP